MPALTPTRERRFGREAPIYGFTSTGGQNTTGAILVPNDGSLDTPSSGPVPGNYFYLNPRNVSLPETMNF